MLSARSVYQRVNSLDANGRGEWFGDAGELKEIGGVTENDWDTDPLLPREWAAVSATHRLPQDSKTESAYKNEMRVRR
jgi:hypothetical protein